MALNLVQGLSRLWELVIMVAYAAEFQIDAREQALTLLN
jgi:hypothetical protein